MLFFTLQELLVAGNDTSSTIIEWIMTKLIHNPQVLKRAQEELKEKVSCN
jgi:cytochrome P450